MASIQTRHSRACTLGKPWTTFDRAAMAECDCGPTYYIAVREGRRLHRERVGKDRQAAERALRKIGTQVDEDAYVPQKKISFAEWGGRWLAGLELPRSTRRSYASTIANGKAAFGEKNTRRLSVEDVKRMLALMREAGLSDSTRAKHLRVLGACLESAIVDGYAARNPVRELRKADKPRKRKREAAYFASDELPPLFAQLDESPYRTLFRTALMTGARVGELSALTWADVDLGDAVIHVRRSFTDGLVGPTKNRETRDVPLAPEVVEMLGAWWGELGRPGDDALVFPGETKTGYLNPQTILRRELYPALARAGIPRVGPTGEKRTFHSFRHSFAKRALESGRPITWLSRHLGHSSLAVTSECYGHWEASERKREAELMEGVFGV